MTARRRQLVAYTYRGFLLNSKTSPMLAPLVASKSPVRMFLLAWATMLFHGSVYTAGTSHGNNICTLGFCISLNKTEIVSEVGLSAYIPCSFYATGFTPQSVVWFKCSQNKSRCGDSEIIFHSKNRGKVPNDFRDRVRMVEADVSRMDCSIIVNDLTPSDSGAYQLRVNGLLLNKPEGFMFKNRVLVTVTDVKPPSISGQTTLKAGDNLTLFCIMDSFPPSRVTWNLPNFNATNVRRGPQLHPTIASAYLVIPNVTAAHSGRYECAVTHHTAHVDVMVTWFTGILNGSGCSLRGPLLTCVCVSGGVPLPVVTWPLLENRTVCSAVTAVSDDSVNTSFALLVDDLAVSAVECVSMHKNGEDRKTLHVQITLEWEEQGLKNITLRLDVFIAFLSGALLSVFLCCLSKTCCRAKKSSGGLDLELMAPQEDPQEYGLKDCGEEGSKADVEYASINFSALRRNNTREVVTNHQGTEYAEIKTKGDGERSLQRNDDIEEEEIKISFIFKPYMIGLNRGLNTTICRLIISRALLGSTDSSSSVMISKKTKQAGKNQAKAKKTLTVVVPMVVAYCRGLQMDTYLS
ncbi:vascular endothelial growth factor receptor 1-like isoform X2 [Phyllopteryx taeniolatus]|uniref:vascular endothelial growth factor receptor 1-like isoform X2 n=1 Tax=Phyllopteryx taeniolatus TaxID=161469 RepID=UPI002AD29632|nr:vascular endothelial growth factor receptor 1-like isoform X2 [Phyllopteryx taeniolatus]